MKNFLKLILAFSLFVVSIGADAQYIQRKAKDSVVAAGTKYITWTSIPDGLYGIQIATDSVSGTTAAVVTLETRIDTINGATWVPYKRNNGTTADSYTMTATDDGTDWLSYIFPIDLPYGNGYRLKFVSTGTQKYYIYASYLKRGRR